MNPISYQKGMEIPDGIYFGMPDAVYHASNALGSSMLKKLEDRGSDFWWESWMNPARPEDKDTPSKLFGRQLHTCVLEGQDVFKSTYEPAYHPGNIKAGKEERARIQEAGKLAIKYEDYRHILAASAFIKANKTLASAFEGGEPEVSVFWTEDGIQFKARFDYLKLRAITDLKSIRNKYGKEFRQCCRDAIGNYEYLVSAEHYREGRAQMAGLMQRGNVFGTVDEEWLSKIVRNELFAFVFVFWQAEGAPISHGIKMSPNNPLFEIARQKIIKAIHNYKTFMREFGPDVAWVPTTDLEELDETDLPFYYQRKLASGE